MLLLCTTDTQRFRAVRRESSFPSLGFAFREEGVSCFIAMASPNASTYHAQDDGQKTCEEDQCLLLNKFQE